MAFAIYLNREQFQPEEPQILDDHLGQDVNFSFVDFVPAAIKRTTTAVMQATDVEYHCFREMIKLANHWLAKNLDWQVVSCETTYLFFKYTENASKYKLKLNDSLIYIYGTEKNNILRILRLWIRRRSISDDTHAQVLDYIDFAPEIKQDYEFSGSRFENLDSVVGQVNTFLKDTGIDGKILTIETVPCEAGADWKFNPELTFTEIKGKTVFVLRIYFLKNGECQEEIDIVDFVPQHITKGGFFRRPKFECFSNALEQATRWLSENSNVNFKTAQSLDFKIKSVASVDTKFMSFSEHGDYLKILRIAFTRSLSTLPKARSSSLRLSSKIFMPLKKNESIKDIKERINDWIKHASNESVNENGQVGSKRKILSAETVHLFCKRDDEEAEKMIDDTFQYNRFGTKNGYIIVSFRVHFLTDSNLEENQE